MHRPKLTPHFTLPYKLTNFEISHHPSLRPLHANLMQHFWPKQYALCSLACHGAGSVLELVLLAFVKCSGAVLGENIVGCCKSLAGAFGLHEKKASRG